MGKQLELFDNPLILFVQKDSNCFYLKNLNERISQIIQCQNNQILDWKKDNIFWEYYLLPQHTNFINFEENKAVFTILHKKVNKQEITFEVEISFNFLYQKIKDRTTSQTEDNENYNIEFQKINILKIKIKNWKQLDWEQLKEYNKETNKLKQIIWILLNIYMKKYLYGYSPLETLITKK